MASICSLSLLICYVHGCSAAVKYTNQTPQIMWYSCLSLEGLRDSSPEQKKTSKLLYSALENNYALTIIHQPSLQGKPSRPQNIYLVPSSSFLLREFRFSQRGKKVHSFGSYSKKGSLSIDKHDDLITMGIQPEYNAPFTANSCYQQWERMKNLNSQMHPWPACSPITM